jgi:hypothetical protein
MALATRRGCLVRRGDAAAFTVRDTRVSRPRRQRRWRPGLRARRAVLGHGRVIGDRERLRHVLLDQQDGQAGSLEIKNGGEDQLHDWREAERRLEHDEARIAHQAASDGEHLLLAAGQRGDFEVTPSRAWGGGFVCSENAARNTRPYSTTS